MSNLETNEAQPEYSILTCKGCGETKKRVMDGRFNNLKDIRWRGECGGMWNGKLCPQCNRERVARNKRNKKRIIG
jgi:hypothetical protein